MASAAAGLVFHQSSPEQLQHWVTNHPGHVEDLDMCGMTVLVAAVRQGYVALVQWLIDVQDADVNGRTRDGCVVLHHAATPRIVRALLKRGADPTLADQVDRWTVLMRQVWMGQAECVPSLLEDTRVRAGINDALVSGWERGATALHLACVKLDDDEPTEMLRLLLEAGADPWARDGKGHLPVEVLRAKYYVDDDAVGFLEEAMRGACLVWIRRAVVAQRGMTLRAEAKGMDTRKPMTSAAANIVFSHLTSVQLRQWVEDHPGHAENRDSHGRTPLSAAVYRNDVALFEWLVDTQNIPIGPDLLRSAGTSAMIRALLERNADPTLLNHGGGTIVMSAVAAGLNGCVASLLEDRRVKASINASVEKVGSERGFTALHYACRRPSYYHMEQEITDSVLPSDPFPARLRLLVGGR